MLQITQLIFFSLIILQPMLVAFGFQESRYFSLLWMMIFAGIVVGKIVDRKHEFPPLNLPTVLLTLILVTVTAVHRFEPRLVLNAAQFLFAVYVIYFIMYYVIFYEEYEVFFDKLFASLPIYFFAVLLISTLLTAYKAPDAPLLYLWQCNGVENRAQLMYGSGNHFGVYLAALTLIAAAYLVAQRKWLHLFTFLCALWFLVVSGARTGQAAVFLFAALLLFRALRLPTLLLFFGIAFIGIVLYLIVFDNRLYAVVYTIFSEINEKVPLRFMPEARYHLLAGREVLWNTLVEMIRNKPVWGHGYYIPFYDFGIDAGYEGGRLIGNEAAPTSESGLLFTVRYGVIATAVYLWFICLPLFQRRRTPMSFYHTYVTLFTITVWIMNDSLFISYSVQMLFFFFIIAEQLAANRQAIIMRRLDAETPMPLPTVLPADG